MEKKLLIVTYYWPPSGGAGVQRWLKLVTYLAKLGVQCHIITVSEEEASYMQLDQSLLAEIPDNISVYKTSSFEPINLFAKVAGKKNVPTAGFSNVDNTKWSQKLINGIRSNLFIPDPRRGWNKFAYRKAVEVIRKEQINTVITTSPPHSSQLIGLKLKQNWSLTWIADLRDPWTDIYYYNILGHSILSRNIDLYYERKVLEKADKILTVSNSLRTLLTSKSSKIDTAKFHVLPNGYDPKDFKEKRQPSSQKTFNIVYTGTMSDIYKPNVIIDAIHQVQSRTDVQVKLTVVGAISKKIMEYIREQLNSFEFIGTVPHAEINHFQIQADLLLLIIPSTKHEEGILTGKLFEYLATKNRIICLGPEKGDAAQIITTCQSGSTYDRTNSSAIEEQLIQEIEYKVLDTRPIPNLAQIELYSRSSQAKQLLDQIFS